MIDVLQNGGKTMLVIAALSIFALALFLVRFYHLHRAQIKSGDFLGGVFNVIARGNLAEAISLCQDSPGPIPQMVRAAILEQRNGREMVGRVMLETGLAEIPRLERHLLMLLAISQLAPLLGLLGTVIGLADMHAVMQAKAPLVHAGDLSGGLTKALACSLFGLAVAIPSFAGYQFLVGRVESILRDMERAYAEVMRFVTQNELPERS